MNQVVITPEVLDRFHDLAEATHRSETEIINEALTGYLTADRRYVEILAESVAAADRGDSPAKRRSPASLPNTPNDEGFMAQRGACRSSGNQGSHRSRQSRRRLA